MMTWLEKIACCKRHALGHGLPALVIFPHCLRADDHLRSASVTNLMHECHNIISTEQLSPPVTSLQATLHRRNPMHVKKHTGEADQAVSCKSVGLRILHESNLRSVGGLSPIGLNAGDPCITIVCRVLSISGSKKSMQCQKHAHEAGQTEIQ